MFDGGAIAGEGEEGGGFTAKWVDEQHQHDVRVPCGPKGRLCGASTDVGIDAQNGM